LALQVELHLVLLQHRPFLQILADPQDYLEEDEEEASSTARHTFRDWPDFFSARKIPGISCMSLAAKVLLTNTLCTPLTIHHALSICEKRYRWQREQTQQQLLQQQQQADRLRPTLPSTLLNSTAFSYGTAEKFRIHLLGARLPEVISSHAFEELFHLLPLESTMMEIEVHLIGPDLESQDSDDIEYGRRRPVVLCDSCQTRQRRLTLRYTQALYHELDSQWHAENTPHLAVALNAGLWLYPSWKPTVMRLLDDDVPLLLTAHDESERDSDFEFVAKMGAHVLVPPQSNPWAYTQPTRRPEKLGQVFYKNAFFCVVQANK
jgi:hypothetical protein